MLDIKTYNGTKKSTCDNRFLGRLSCYPCYNNAEGNTLAAMEVVRLLEDAGSVTAKQSNGKTENTQFLGPTVEFNPPRFSERTRT